MHSNRPTVTRTTGLTVEQIIALQKKNADNEEIKWAAEDFFPARRSTRINNVSGENFI